MKKIYLFLIIILLAIITYAFKQNIETIGTEEEMNFVKKQEQAFINSELKIYRKSIEQKKHAEK